MLDRRLEVLEHENSLLRERVAQLEAALYGAGTLTFPVEWRLTATETRILGALVRQRLATRSALMAALYSDRPDDAPHEKTVDVLVRKLRAKIEPLGMKITTAWGQGYALDHSTRELLGQKAAA